MLTVPGVGWRSCPSCQESELRPPAAQSALPPEYRQPLYRTWRRVGLSAIGPGGTLMTLFLIGLASSGCRLSRSGTDDAFAKMQNPEVTGSLKQPPRAPTESDLAFARNAASDVLTKGDKDSSQP